MQIFTGVLYIPQEGQPYITFTHLMEVHAFVSDRIFVHDDSLKYMSSFLGSCPRSYGGYLVTYKVKDGKALIID